MSLEPVLTPEQWAVALHQIQRTPHPEEFDADLAPVQRAIKHIPWTRAQMRSEAATHAGRIALHNAALPDTDPRKLRREWIADLRIAQNEAQDAAWRSCQNGSPGKPCDDCQAAVDAFKARLQSIANAIASYLPPETP
jgi:hypothetical protein